MKTAASKDVTRPAGQGIIHAADDPSWAVGWPKMTKHTRAPLGGAAHGGTAVDETRAQQLALAIKAARRRLDAVALANQGLKRRIIAERLGLSLGRVHQMLVRAREDAEILALHDAGGWPELITDVLHLRRIRVLGVLVQAGRLPAPPSTCGGLRP